MKTNKYILDDIVVGEEGLLRGPFGSDLKKSLYVPKDETTYKVYLQENILKSDLTKGEHYITEEYFNKKMKRYAVNEGDFIVTCDGTLGEIFQLNNIKEKGIISSSLLRITLNNEIVDEKFFPYFWVSRIKHPLIRSHDNSVLKHLPGVKAIRNFEIELPELQVQKQIAKVLSDLDAKIEVNNKINQELETLAKTIYDYWFVQFDFPDQNGKPYKSSGGKMVYNEELKREIPEGWEKGVLDDIAKIVRGVSYNKHDIKTPNDENVTPVLRATNITGNVIDLENMVYVPDEFVSEKQLMNKYDVLITMSSGSKDHIGKNGMFYFDKKVAFGAFCAKLEAKENYQFFLSSYMQSEFISETIKKECLGTSINNLNGSLVKGFRLVKPSEDVLKSFNKKIQPIHDKIGNNQKENQKLAALRDWLLPMLMNGQVTVGEAKEQLGMVAEEGEKYK